MKTRLKEWAAISSYSRDVSGLNQMLEALRTAFSELGGKEEIVPLPARETWTLEGPQEVHFGSALTITKRAEAPLQIYLGGHYDTVHEKVWEAREDGDRLYGPGVADMKGGLVVLLESLRALEKEGGERVGWRVVLNPDEELGSIASRSLVEEKAKGCALGLLFEPTLPDGKWVSERKGSFNGILLAKGKAAHAGRDFDEGRSAILALAEVLTTLPKIKGVQFNVGQIQGGSAPNIVAEEAAASLNVRYEKPFERELRGLLGEVGKSRGVAITLHPLSERPPKPISPEMERLMALIEGEHGRIRWQKTGGVCDGNLVAAQGVPCIDTLGVRGDGLHTRDEYCEISSLDEQIKRVSSFLLGLNSGKVKWENSKQSS